VQTLAVGSNWLPYVIPNVCDAIGNFCVFTGSSRENLADISET